MALTADTGAKFDRDKVSKILSLSLELSDKDLALTINKLRQLQSERNIRLGDHKNTDTIST